MRVYISGKITGLEYEEAKANFEAAEELLTAIGMVPVNPMNNGIEINAPWEQHMVKDIRMLMGCKAIMMLSNWTQSRGARIEKFIADEMGMIVLYETTVILDQPTILKLKSFIEETTGLRFNQCERQRVSEDGFYANILFARYASTIYNMSNDDIAYALKRSKQAVKRYFRHFDREYTYNKRFRALTDTAEKHLITNVSL